MKRRRGICSGISFGPAQVPRTLGHHDTAIAVKKRESQTPSMQPRDARQKKKRGRAQDSSAGDRQPPLMKTASGSRPRNAGGEKAEPASRSRAGGPAIATASATCRRYRSSRSLPARGRSCSRRRSTRRLPRTPGRRRPRRACRPVTHDAFPPARAARGGSASAPQQVADQHAQDRAHSRGDLVGCPDERSPRRWMRSQACCPTICSGARERPPREARADARRRSPMFFRTERSSKVSSISPSKKMARGRSSTTRRTASWQPAEKIATGGRWRCMYPRSRTPPANRRAACSFGSDLPGC